jgi:hypothetical protein
MMIETRCRQLADSDFQHIKPFRRQRGDNVP